MSFSNFRCGDKHPYQTPSVNQYLAILNASLQCNINCSLCRLTFASFKRILTAQMKKSGNSYGGEERTNV